MKLPNPVKKHTYVPTSTDTDANMEQPTAPEDSSGDFYSGVNDVAQKVVNTRAYINPLVPNVVSCDIHMFLCRKLRHCAASNREWLKPYLDQVSFKK